MVGSRAFAMLANEFPTRRFDEARAADAVLFARVLNVASHLGGYTEHKRALVALSVGRTVSAYVLRNGSSNPVSNIMHRSRFTNCHEQSQTHCKVNPSRPSFAAHKLTCHTGASVVARCRMVHPSRH